jgi:hypothetical protein
MAVMATLRPTNQAPTPPIAQGGHGQADIDHHVRPRRGVDGEDIEEARQHGGDHAHARDADADGAVAGEDMRLRPNMNRKAARDRPRR